MEIHGLATLIPPPRQHRHSCCAECIDASDSASAGKRELPVTVAIAEANQPALDPQHAYCQAVRGNS
jgi:hypothetical protein